MLEQELRNFLQQERAIRQAKLQHHGPTNLKDLGAPLLLLGQQYRRYLHNEKLFASIDCNDSKDRITTQLMSASNYKGDDFPLICFDNIDKVNATQEKFLLAIFDSEQNHELFHHQVDLSRFILLVTSSGHDVTHLSHPLTSRLDLINVKEVEPNNF
jgi:hypothetical protein